MTNLKPQTSNLEPKARPILFSTPMVQALLAGRKTQTRRVVKNVFYGDFRKMEHLAPGKYGAIFKDQNHSFSVTCPYGKPGDLLWVRETFRYSDWPDHDGTYEYKADMEQPLALWNQNIWKPSIHMPKAAARIWLRITDVRVERLQDITEADARAEGIFPVDTMLGTEWFDYDGDGITYIKPVSSFMTLWASINGWENVAQNPYVWVVSFQVVSTTGKPEFSPKMQTRL